MEYLLAPLPTRGRTCGEDIEHNRVKIVYTKENHRIYGGFLFVWRRWRESAKNVEFDKAILIYPFLWSEEVNIETASKSIVPFDELFATNMEYREKFGIGD